MNRGEVVDLKGEVKMWNTILKNRERVAKGNIVELPDNSRAHLKLVVTALKWDRIIVAFLCTTHSAAINILNLIELL